MATHLDLGSLIVAILIIAFTFNPQVIQGITWLYRWLRSVLTPSSTRCRLVLWRNFNPGKLHCHSGLGSGLQCTHCSTALTHEECHCCWTSTLALVFNNMWNGQGSEKWAKKPAGLPLDKHFVLTEAKVILAYFLLTARLNWFIDEVLGSRLDYLELSEENGVVLAHLGPAHRVLDLTKDEVDKILDGWPPFYRETFTSLEGHVLMSPLKTFDQVRRPAWIVAIGLGQVQPADVYIQRPGKSLFFYAMDRVLKVLHDQFKTEWGGNVAVDKTIEDIRDMRTKGASASNNRWKAHGSSTLSYEQNPPLSALAQKQCEALMRVFNDINITREDKAIIDMSLEACLARVSLGVYIVLKYEPAGRQITIPPLLQGDKLIYLRDCTFRNI